MTLDPNFPPPEVGVYWKDGPTFVFIEGAALSRTKAGGRAASFATDGIRGQHWDAVIEGPTSKNHVKDRRPIFYLYVPDGSSAADYALIKLQKKGDRREFQVGSFGGIGGGKSGVKKDKEVPCSSEHVGIRMYKITLNEDLKPGEYAFFMGTARNPTCPQAASPPLQVAQPAAASTTSTSPSSRARQKVPLRRSHKPVIPTVAEGSLFADVFRIQHPVCPVRHLIFETER